MTSKLDAALKYLSRGWSVFPLRDKKNPYVRWEVFTKRLPTVEEVTKWWTAWPTAEIGLVTGAISGVVVVDADTYKGNTPQIADSGLRSRTARGGEHKFFAHPGSDVRTSTYSKLNTDIRGEGGYVVLPPSTGYTWESYKAMAPCPDWLRLNGPPSKVSVESDGWISEVLRDGAGSGGRNDTTARLAGYYAGKGIPVDIAKAMLLQWGEKTKTLCADFDAEEMVQTIESVYRTADRPGKTRKKGTNGEALETGNFRTLSLQSFMRQYAGGEIAFTVQDWLPSATIAVVASPPEGMKTWLVDALAVSIASGVPFLGKFEVREPGPVTIVQQEDANAQTANRFATIIAAAMHTPLPDTNNTWDFVVPGVEADLPIHFHAERALTFRDAKAMLELERHLDEVRPRLVIIDPFYYVVDNENYMADAIKDMKPLKELRDKYNTSFLFVHHVTKSAVGFDRQGMWGSQFLNAFIETGWQMRKEPEGDRIFVGRHFKAAAKPSLVALTFEIDTMMGRFNARAEDITPDEAAEAMVVHKKKIKEDDPLARYLEVIAEHGPMQTKDIADRLQVAPSSVTRAMNKLQEQNHVSRIGQRWMVAGSLPQVEF